MKPKTLKQRYEELYEDEERALPRLDLERWPRNRWEATCRVFPTKADRVLEIGCGNGVILSHILDRCGRVTGIELAENRCRIALDNLENRSTPVQILAGNIEDETDHLEGPYDVIIWADVIEHVVDIFACMEKVFNLLVPDGLLITATPNFAYIRHRLKLLLGIFPSTSGKLEGFGIRTGEMYDGGHLHYFTHRTLKTLYKKFGIEPIETIGFGRLGRLHNLRPSLLSGSILLVGRKRGSPRSD